MNLTVNGESRTFEHPLSVHQLLSELSQVTADAAQARAQESGKAIAAFVREV